MLGQIDDATIEGRMLIGGEWRASGGGGTPDVRDAANPSLVGRVPAWSPTTTTGTTPMSGPNICAAA